MRTHNTQMGAGTSAALPMLSEMLGSLLNYGAAPRKPQFRRKVVAVMPDGSETTISKSRNSGYNLPDGRCFTSHLSSAKQAWIDAGATIKTINS
jgi:hypothetical protein